MYKILALDIDDTLLNSKRELSEANKQAIIKAREAGICVTLATGRSFTGAKRVSDELGLTGLMINYGGAVITDIEKQEAISFSEVDSDRIIELLELAREIGIHAHIYQDDTVISEVRNEWVKGYTGILSLPLKVDPDLRKKKWERIPKVLFITYPDHAEKLIPRLKKRYEGILKVSGSTAGFIEFNNVGFDKGTALKKIADSMGVKQSEVVAAGDNTLDAEMIEWAGLGVAVDNAKDAIKQIADIVVPSCDDDGIAYLINNYLLK
ncbi:MAG: HAD family phosphatase [Clostridia bacterium]|nr:HAD family phosphatase [Clostridia bacterium]